MTMSAATDVTASSKTQSRTILEPGNLSRNAVPTKPPMVQEILGRQLHL